MLFSILPYHIQCINRFVDNNITYTVIDDISAYVGGDNVSYNRHDKYFDSTAVTPGSNIEEVIIPYKILNYQIVEIGARAFRRCYNLKKVTINAAIKQISSYAFYECHNLISINIPSTCEYIGFAAISCITLDDFSTPSGVISIKFEPNATLKYVDTYGIERKEVIIIFFCGSNPPSVPPDALFYGARIKTIFAPKAMNWGGADAIVDESVCNLMQEIETIKRGTCKPKNKQIKWQLLLNWM